MPLSVYGLCDAVIWIPIESFIFLVERIYGIAGVGIKPRKLILYLELYKIP